MIVEDAQHPYLFRDVPVASSGAHARSVPVPFDSPLRRPAGPSSTPDTGWGIPERASLCRAGRHRGLTTGTEVLDGPAGGFRPGKAYVLRSPGAEAVTAARRLVAAAQEVGLPGLLVDPETVMRHAVPETGLSDWSVVRPQTAAALGQVGPQGPAGRGMERFIVVAAPQRIVAHGGKPAAAAFVRWARELLTSAAQQGTAVVFVLPWSGDVLSRPIESVMRLADEVVHFERLYDGGLLGRNLRDGRLRIQDAQGERDPARERSAHGPLVPWAAHPAS